METLDINRPNLHILLIEDSDEDAADLQDEFEFGLSKHYNYKEFFQHEKTVSNGLEALRGAIEAGQPYDFAILDYKLPQVDGDQATGSTELAEFIDRHPACCDHMVQLTSFADDPDVAHIWNRRQSSHLLFSKHRAERLVEFMRFHEVKDGLEKVKSPYVLRGVHSLSPMEIGWLCGRIKVSWKDLGEEIREKARAIFNISESGNGEIQIGFKM